MIRNIFIPEAYNGYYILTTKIVGVQVTHNTLYATVIQASGWDRRILQHIYEPLDNDTSLPFSDRIDTALRNLSNQITPYDRLYLSLPSKDIIYKELTLPFTDIAKIEQVAPFEIEDALPFNLDEAVVASLITRKESEQSTVLTTVIRHETLEAYVPPFEKHGLSPDRITYDTIALYTTLSSMEQFRQDSEVVAYLDIDISESRICILEHGSLRLLRTINHGVTSICDLATQSYEALQTTTQACDINSDTAARTQLHSDIQFTLTAANKMLGPQTDITNVMITGLGGQITDIESSLNSISPATPNRMNSNLPLRMEHVTTQTNSHIPSVFITSVATALPVKTRFAFTVRRNIVSPKERTERMYQISTAAALLFLFFIGFFAYSMYRAHTLNNQVTQRRQALRDTLKKTFDIKAKGEQADPAKLLKTTIPQKVRKEENVWFSLSQQQTFSFLYYLQELSTHIDRKELGLTLQKLVIQKGPKQNVDTIKMEGTVRDSNALRALERALRDCKLFTNIPPMQEEKFDITLTVAQPAGRAA